jgi:hypothetical protein
VPLLQQSCWWLTHVLTHPLSGGNLSDLPRKMKQYVEANGQNPMAPEKLHKLLLKELKEVSPAIAAMSPEELLLELQALQIAALHNWDTGGPQGNLLADKTEELLVQTVSHCRFGVGPKARTLLQARAAAATQPIYTLHTEHLRAYRVKQSCHQCCRHIQMLGYKHDLCICASRQWHVLQ